MKTKSIDTPPRQNKTYYTEQLIPLAQGGEERENHRVIAGAEKAATPLQRITLFTSEGPENSKFTRWSAQHFKTNLLDLGKPSKVQLICLTIEALF